jgi:rhamnose transport system substrate-binding protein
MILAIMSIAATGLVAQKYAIVFKNTGNPYGEKQMAGFKAGIEEQKFEAILRAPDAPTAEAQIQIIEQLIAQKVASICIVGNDRDALQPVLTKAKNAGIKVFSLDSGVNPQSRLTHVNQADSEKIGRTLIQGAYDMIGGKGEIAVLSATSQATNQNLWIDYMKKELTLPKYKDVKLVKVAYGDDLRDKSVSEAEGLLRSYPNLKCIIAPTTVGIAAAGKVLTDKGLKGKVFLTGLGLPSEMATYIENGVCPLHVPLEPDRRRLPRRLHRHRARQRQDQGSCGRQVQRRQARQLHDHQGARRRHRSPPRAPLQVRREEHRRVEDRLLALVP